MDDSDKLAAYRDEEGRVVIVRPLATISVTPWTQRMLETVAAIEGISVEQAISNHVPDDEGMVHGEASDFLPVAFWPLVDEENATDTQLACVAFDCGFHSMIDTLWCDVERAEELPATPDQARQALKAWLASTPAPDDDLYVAALEHALAGRFSEMGATIRTILSHIDAAP